ncbi:MAG: protein kinase [Clostridia bacterium]|nr:protein kinase [Clostridia bacterium]
MFNFFKTRKLLKVIEKSEKIVARKMPNWLRNIDITNIVSNNMLLEVKDFSLKDAHERKMLLKVYNVLKDSQMYFSKMKVIPIISKNLEELLGIIFYAEDRKECYYWNITKKCNVAAYMLMWHKIFSDLNSGGISINESINLFKFDTDIFEHFYASKEVDFEHQEWIFASTVFKEIAVGEKICPYNQLYIFISPKLQEYVENINAFQFKAVGYSRLYELIINGFENVSFNSNNIVTLAKDELEHYFNNIFEREIYSENSLGKVYKLTDKIGIFMYSESLEYEKVMSHINCTLSLNSTFTNMVNIRVNKPMYTAVGNAIVYDKYLLKILGFFVYLDMQNKLINEQPLKRLSMLLNLSIINSNISKDISLSDICYVKDEDEVEEFGGSGYFNICTFKNNTKERCINVTHENIFDVNNRYSYKDMLSLIFKQFEYESRKNDLFVSNFPKSVIKAFDDFKNGLDVQNDCMILNAISSQVQIDLKYESNIFPYVFPHIFLSSSKNKKMIDYLSRLKGNSITVDSPFSTYAGCFFEENVYWIKEYIDSKVKYVMPKVKSVVYIQDLEGYVHIFGIIYEKSNHTFTKLDGIIVEDAFKLILVYLHFKNFLNENSNVGKLPENIGIDLDSFEIGVDSYVSKKINTKVILDYLSDLIFKSKDSDVSLVLSSLIGRTVKIKDKKMVVRLYDNIFEKSDVKDVILALNELKKRGKLLFCKVHKSHYVKNKYNICPICAKDYIFVSSTDEIDEVIQQFKKKNRYVSYVIFNEDKDVDKLLNDMQLIPKKVMKNAAVVIRKIFSTSKKQLIGYVYSVILKSESRLVTSLLRELTNKQVLQILEQFEKINLCGRIDFSLVTDIFDDFVITLSDNGAKVYIKNFEIILKKIKKVNLPKEIIESIFSLSGNLYDLNELYKEVAISKILPSLDSLCKIHNLWYASIEGCKLCKKEKIKYARVKITEDKPFSKGGEAYIYETEDKGVLFKMWKENKVVISKKYRQVLSIMAKSLKVRPYNDYEVYIALPKAIAKTKFEGEECIGYLMDKIEDSKALRLLENKAIVSMYGFSKRDIMQILINFGKGLSYIHENGMYIGDLSGNNVLFDAEKRVYILDTDSFGSETIKSSAFTIGYVDPNALNEGGVTTSKNSDYYSFAVIAFLILTGMHPFKGVYKNKQMDLTERMKQCISVLGNHDIILPKHISKEESWGWMNEHLKKAFLDIFENGMRFNIAPQLIMQLKTLPKDEENDDEKEKALVEEIKAEKENDVYEYFDFENAILAHGVVKSNCFKEKVWKNKTRIPSLSTERTLESIVFETLPKNTSKRYDADLKILNIKFLQKGKMIVCYGIDVIDGAKHEMGVLEVKYTDAFDITSVRGGYNVESSVLQPSYMDVYLQSKKLYLLDLGRCYVDSKMGRKSLNKDGDIKKVIVDDATGNVLAIEKERKMVIFDVNEQVLIEITSEHDVFKIIDERAFCYYNNSLYIVYNDYILAYNLFNGNKKVFKTECEELKNAKTICKTYFGFRAFLLSGQIIDILPE